MVKTTIELPPDIDDKFRRMVALRIGMRKGALSEALQQAIVMWVDKQLEKEKSEKAGGKK